MKLDDQLRLATWLLAQGEVYKTRALDLPTSRDHFGERMRLQGSAAACFELCKQVLASDFNEVLYAEPKPDLPESQEDKAPSGDGNLYKVGEQSIP